MVIDLGDTFWISEIRFGSRRCDFYTQINPETNIFGKSFKLTVLHFCSLKNLQRFFKIQIEDNSIIICSNVYT